MFYRLEFEEDDIIKPEVALVADPAIELKSLMLKKSKSPDGNNTKEGVDKIKLSKLQTFDNDKQIIAGPALVCDKWIERYDEETDDHYWVMFTPEQVKVFKNAFERDGGIINFEHSDVKVKAKVIFSEIVEDDSKNIDEWNYHTELKKGDWFLSIYVEDKKDWKVIKEKMRNGYSVEAMFNHNIIQFKKEYKNEQNEMEKELNEFKSEILSEFKSMIASLKEDEKKEDLEDEKKEDEMGSEKEDDTEVEAEKEDYKEEDEDKEVEAEKEEDEVEAEEEGDSDEGETESTFEFTEEMYNAILSEISEIQTQINEIKEGDEEELSYEDKEEDLTKLSKKEQRIKRIAQNLSKIK